MAMEAAHQKLWNTKAALKGRRLSCKYTHKKTEQPQLNNPVILLIVLEKQVQSKSEASEGKEIINTREEISEIKTKKCQVWRSMSTVSAFEKLRQDTA